MAKIQVDVEQIANRLKEMFLPYIDVRDLKAHAGEHLENHLITRSLAAYAVFWKNGCTEREAGESVTDGSGDNGIDAIYYNSRKKRITIVQSKYIKDGIAEPESAEIRTFRDGINDFIENNIAAFNEKIQNKTDLINKIKEFGTKIDLILVYTSKEDLAEPARNIIDRMMLDLNGEEEDEESVFSFHLLHKKKIISSLTSALGGIDINLEFLLKDYGVIKHPLTSYYGKINGLKLQEWWTNHSDSLFRDNIRNSLGDTSVNSILAKTIEEQPDFFWFFNNGITVIADKLDKTPENGNNKDYGFFKATNASIVNGAQTYSTIGKCGLKGIDVEKIEVPFRAIQVDRGIEKIKQEITRYNNTQNTILPKDFLAQDQVQISLQEKLSLIGCKYSIKRDSEHKADEKIFDYDEATEALIMSNTMPNLAAVFRKEIGRFYNTESSLYKTLYNTSTNSYQVFNSVKIARDFKQKIKLATENILSRRRDLEKVSNISESGYLIIAQCLFKKQSRQHIDSMKTKDCAILYTIDDIEIVLEKIIEHVNIKFPNNYIVTLFQNVKKVTDVFDSI